MTSLSEILNRKVTFIKKVESKTDLKENTRYGTKNSNNTWQLMFWDDEYVTLWSNNNSTVTRKFKTPNFLKNWYVVK